MGRSGAAPLQNGRNPRTGLKAGHYKTKGQKQIPNPVQRAKGFGMTFLAGLREVGRRIFGGYGTSERRALPRSEFSDRLLNPCLFRRKATQEPAGCRRYKGWILRTRGAAVLRPYKNGRKPGTGLKAGQYVSL